MRTASILVCCLFGTAVFGAGTPEELYRRAESKFLAGEFSAAEPHLVEIRERHPRHRLFWPAGLMWARCAADLDEAGRRFRLLAAQAPSEVKAECEAELAFLKVIGGDFEGAERAYAAWLADNPNNSRVEEAGFWRGLSLRESGRIEEAKAALKTAKEKGRDPAWRAQAALLLARIMYDQEEFAAARLEYLALAGELWAKDVRPQALLGAARSGLKTGREDEAAKLLRRLIAETPDLPEARQAESLLERPSAAPLRLGVQVGAFGKEELAQRLKREYEGRGFGVSIAKRRSGSLDLYGVVLGPYASREEAERVKAKLRQTGVEAFIAEF